MCLARLSPLTVQNRRVEAGQTTAKLTTSRLCGAKTVSIGKKTVLLTVIETHYRYLPGVVLTLLSEYLQAEHTYYSRYDNLPYKIFNICLLRSSVSRRSSSRTSCENQRQEICRRRKRRRAFPSTKEADKNHALKAKTK